jgi:hypothetical protein
MSHIHLLLRLFGGSNVTNPFQRCVRLAVVGNSCSGLIGFDVVATL